MHWFSRCVSASIPSAVPFCLHFIFGRLKLRSQHFWTICDPISSHRKPKSNWHSQMSFFVNRFLRTVAICLATVSVFADEPLKSDSESEHTSLSGLLVLDDCDPDYKGKDSYEDNLSCIDGDGKLKFRISGFNNCESIGSNHMIATDTQRGCFWVLENVGNRIRKFDRDGKELLTIKDIEAFALAVDPETGNLWVLTSKGTIYGDRTEVFDGDGKSIAKYDVHGYDIVYDEKGKAFWIAGKNLAKVETRTGKFLCNTDITTWCASSVDVNSKTGTVWVTVRHHRDVAVSTNRLLEFDNDGNRIKTIDLGEGSKDHPIVPFCVSVDQDDGSVWLTLFRYGVRRYSSTGELQIEHIMWALAAEADPESHGAWVVTPQKVVRINSDGTILNQVDNKSGTTQAWMATYR